MFIALWASLKLAEEEGFGICLRQPQPLRRYTPSHEPPVDSPQGCLCGGSPSTGFESLLLLSAEKEFLPDGYYFVGWISKLAEEEGFEPSYPGIPDKRFSRPPHSTTLPPLRVGVRTARRKGAPQKHHWRRVRDLNPGDGFAAYTISNRAPSATRTTLRGLQRSFYRIHRATQGAIAQKSRRDTATRLLSAVLHNRAAATGYEGHNLCMEIGQGRVRLCPAPDHASPDTPVYRIEHRPKDPVWTPPSQPTCSPP